MGTYSIIGPNELRVRWGDLISWVFRLYFLKFVPRGCMKKKKTDLGLFSLLLTIDAGLTHYVIRQTLFQHKVIRKYYIIDTSRMLPIFVALFLA